MASKQKVKNILDGLVDNHPQNVIASISQGDVLDRSAGLQYVIDNPDIDLDLGNYATGAVPYGRIFSHFTGGKEAVLKVANNRNVVPFSEIFNAKAGHCFERGVVTQLAAQRTRAAYMINGIIDLDRRCGVDHHVFNLVEKEDQLFLVDTSLPFGSCKDGTYEKPFIAPVKNIIGSEMRIVVPKSFAQDRTYSIF
jgi:hypothetical protein